MSGTLLSYLIIVVFVKLITRSLCLFSLQISLDSTYCIQRGTLLDNKKVRTLQGPDQHTIHCLVDVPDCVASGYQILVAPENEGDDYIQDVRLDQHGNDLAVDMARTVGKSCSTCYGGGTQRSGFAATVIGTIDEETDVFPPILKVKELLPEGTPCPKIEAEPPIIAIACFSGDMTVEEELAGTKKMKDLQLGDRVKTTLGVFEPVYSFGHYNPNTKAEFVQLKSSNKGSTTTIELSKDHMLFVEHSEAPIPAVAIKVGDVLRGAVVVESMHHVVRKGVFSPFTPSGTILVNGVAASTFISLQEESSVLKIGSSFSTPLTFQWLAHSLEAPHRIYCRLVGDCTTEMYNKDGVSVWVAEPLVWTQWLLAQGPIVIVILLVPTIFVLGLFYGLELLTTNMALSMITATAMSYMYYVRGTIAKQA